MKKKDIKKPTDEELDKMIDEAIQEEEVRAVEPNKEEEQPNPTEEEPIQEEEQVEDTPTEETPIEEEEQPIDNEEEANPIHDEEHIVEGYAIVFNTLSVDLGGYREIILPTAVNEELIRKSDIYYLFNHNNNSTPLARSKYGEGSLHLTIDEKGLKYSFNCLNSEFYEIVKRGDLDKSSFAFSLPNDGSGEEWVKDDNYNYIRKITKIDKLYDCSAVLSPAYASTELYARNLNRKEVNEDYFKPYEEILNKLSK